jgi:CRISPR-associated protein Cmr3
MSAQQWRFSALDTLFFKESRPIESVGGSQLSSVFPPPARTLIGAIRTAIGEANSVDWGGVCQG